jgi:hypothetical protein
MDTTITTKRMRKSSVILTDRLCTRRVTERIKFYDRKCPGLYVSITPAGVATFFLQVHRSGDRQAAHRLAGRL